MNMLGGDEEQIIASIIESVEHELVCCFSQM